MLNDRQREIMVMFHDPITIKKAAHDNNLNYFTLRREVQKLIDLDRITAIGAETTGGVIYQSIKPEMLPRFVDASGNRRSFIDICKAFMEYVNDRKQPVPTVATNMSNFYFELVRYSRAVQFDHDSNVDIDEKSVERLQNYLNELLPQVEGMQRVIRYIIETDEFFDATKIKAFTKDPSWDDVIVKQAYNVVAGTKMYDVPMPDHWLPNESKGK